MQTEQTNNPHTVKIAAMRLQTLVVEVQPHKDFTLKLKPEDGIHGFIILLKPLLPTIN
jgi:hypothetical protein